MKKILLLLIIINLYSFISCKYNTNINKSINISIRKPYYIIEYDSNIDNENNTKKQIVNYNDKIYLTNSFKREGYIFKEWNTKKDGTGISYINNQEICNLTSIDQDKVILYAIWTKIE